MQRLTQTPRPDWPARVEEVGLTYHTPDGVTYWDESASYRFSPAQIDVLEAAGNTLHAMCLEAVTGHFKRDHLGSKFGDQNHPPLSARGLVAIMG